jgi:hypothetical protein
MHGGTSSTAVDGWMNGILRSGAWTRSSAPPTESRTADFRKITGSDTVYWCMEWNREDAVSWLALHCVDFVVTSRRIPMYLGLNWVFFWPLGHAYDVDRSMEVLTYTPKYIWLTCNKLSSFAKKRAFLKVNFSFFFPSILLLTENTSLHSLLSKLVEVI